MSAPRSWLDQQAVALEGSGPIQVISQVISIDAATENAPGSMSANDKRKLNDRISVVDHGAIGNGIANDATAVNAAIQALTDGGIVWLPAGTYKCLSAITIRPNVMLVGDGSRQVNGFATPATTLVDGRTNPSTPFITFDADDGGDPTSRGAGMRDLMIQFPSSGRTNHGVLCNATSGVTFKNVHFTGATAGSGIPTAVTANIALVRLVACEAITFEDCTFHYGQRQVSHDGSGSGGPYTFIRCWFYDCNEEWFYSDSNGDHDIRFESCGFDAIYRTTIPSLGVHLKANGFEIVNCSFQGYPDKAPSGTFLKVAGVGSVRGCKFACNATAFGYSGANVEFSDNEVIAYTGIYGEGQSSLLTGKGNSFKPQTISDEPGNLDPFKNKTAVIINDPYNGICAVDFGPNTYGAQAAYTPALVAGANIDDIEDDGGLVKITTIDEHGLQTGSRVTIDDVTGTVSSAAEGTWTITRVDDTSFTLDGSTHSGSYTSGGTVLFLAFWYESIHVGGEDGGDSYMQFTSGVVHHMRSLDQSTADGTTSPNIQLGALVRLDVLDPQVRHLGSGVTLSHADVTPNIITPEDFTGAMTYHLPAIHPGLEYCIMKRPDVVAGGNPAQSITIDTADSSKIFLEGSKDGLDSIVNSDTTDYNAAITLCAKYWYDTVEAEDVLRWYVKEARGNWRPGDSSDAGIAAMRFPTAKAQHIVSLDGSTWIRVGVEAGPNLGDSDSSFDVTDGFAFVLPASTLSADRTYTLDTTGASDGAIIQIWRLDATAHQAIFVNGGTSGGTMHTIPNSTKRRVDFRYDAALGDWVIAGYADLVTA